MARARAELAGLSGKARALPLARLGKLCQEAYWRAGPGSSMALAYLNEEITVLEEAIGYFDPRDGIRRQAVCALGVARGTRFVAHDGAAADGDEGVRLIEEALGSTGIPALTVEFARVILGQVHVRRAVAGFQSPDVMLAMMRDGAPGAVAELDRAADCYRRVLATAAQPQFVETARKMLDIIEPVRALMASFGSGSLSGPLAAMGPMVQAMQKLESAGFGVRMPAGASIFDFDWTSRVSPDEWPVAVVEGDAPKKVPQQEREAGEPRARPPVSADVEAMRRDLRGLIGGGDPYAAVADILRAGEAPDRIDDLVALATGVVHEADPATGLDQLLLSVALFLRGRRDEGGWADPDDAAGGDAQAAAQSLLAAAKTIPDEDPDGIPALVHLATLLPPGTLAELAAHLGSLTATLRTVGAEALYFPEAAASLRWNAVRGRFETADVTSGAETVVVLGDEVPPAARQAVDDRIVSHVASLSQLKELAQREVRPITGKPVFVANPRGDRESATMAAMLLRRSFYPASAGLGRLVENADGTGTADEVRDLVGASMVHLDCGITAAGALELAGPSELDLTGVALEPGGLVILPPDHFLPLADILLEAGCAGVVGWRRPVSEATAALAVFVLHAELADRGRSPAEAVREVHRWFRRPDRGMLPQLLAGYAERLDDIPAQHRTSMVYRGR